MTLMVTVVMVTIALSSALHFTELVWHCLLWRDSRSKYRRLLSLCVQICKLLSSRHVYCVCFLLCFLRVWLLTCVYMHVVSFVLCNSCVYMHRSVSIKVNN